MFLTQIPFGLAMAATGLGLYVFRRSEPASRHDLSLLEDLGATDQFLVHVDVFHLKHVGCDRGALWIENGAINFCGSASSFVMGAQDFTLTESSDRRRIQLHLRGHIQSSWLFLRVLKTAHSRDGAELLRQLRDLSAGANPTDSPRQWPPLNRRT